MAQMFPEQPDPYAQRGEVLVYQVLQKDLPQDWIVIHSFRALNRLRHHYVNFEADFIILVPRHGLVCVEVKDWKHTRIRDGVWEHVVAGDQWRPMDGKRKSPLHQAALAAKNLRDSMLERKAIRADRKLEFCSMAILLQNKPAMFESNPVPEDTEICTSCHIPLTSLYICGYDALCTDLAEKIRFLFTRKDTCGQNMSTKCMQDIRNYLVPNVPFYRDLNAYSRMLEDAGREICHVLPLLESSTGGVRVEGCAGSGKTTMACMEFARLARAHPDKRFLFLCYNLKLSNMLEHTPALAERMDENHVISAFHGFCIAYGLQPAGRMDLVEDDAYLSYFNEGDAYDVIREELCRQPKFDYLFVDEAQDFGEAQWELLRHCLTEDGKMYIFADRFQKVNGSKCFLPDIPTRIHLRHNLRNAMEIAHFANLLLPEQERGVSLDISGETVRIAPGSDDPAQRAAYVSQIIKEIREKYHVAPCDIVVLSPRRIFREACCLSLVPELSNMPMDGETEAAMWERYTRCTMPDADRVLGDTTRKFKGLESPFVILADIPEPDTEESDYRFTRGDLYVAITRARFALYIVPTIKGKQFLNKLQRQ